MYIKMVTHENKNFYICSWLLLISSFIAIIIIVGGLTRLTDSGLSITRWDIVTGILPPLTLEKWENSFNLYKQIPEFKLLNNSMTLEQFKYIYWWEYIHRLLGRLLGLMYIFPLLFFSFKKFFDRNSLISFYLIFLLIIIQGFIGWYMVKSGLSERTDVSHYRLSIHLTLAIIIFILVFASYLKYKNIKRYPLNKKLPFYLPQIFIFFVVSQISIGAFVSGLDAGQIYQSWPLMNQSYFPNDSNVNDLFSLSAFETPSIVQFIHRNLAYFIFILFFFIAVPVFFNTRFEHLRKITFMIFITLLLQIILGILTILSGAQIVIASMHQFGSILLIITSVILVFKNSRIN